MLGNQIVLRWLSVVGMVNGHTSGTMDGQSCPTVTTAFEKVNEALATLLPLWQRRLLWPTPSTTSKAP